MSLALTKLWIPVNDPVVSPNAPSMDGFSDNRDTSVSEARSPDLGYATGPRIEYSNGVPYPDVVLSAIRHGDFVYLHFNVQSDQHFDDIDRVVVGLRSGFPVAGNPAVRLDIAPLHDGTGAGTGADPPTTYKIRDNQSARELRWWTSSGGAPWTARGTTVPTGVAVRVRSWVLPTPPTPYVHEFGWAVEIQLPINQTAAGSTNWLDLGEPFGLYLNVIRVAADAATPSQNHMSTQFTWPRDEDPAHPGSLTRYLTGQLSASMEIPDNYYGEVRLSGTSPQGVKFHKDALGNPEIGVLRGGVITNVIDTNTAHSNAFKARIENTDTQPGPSKINAEFRIANWGITAYAPWDLIPGDSPNPAGVVIPGGGALTAPDIAEAAVDWQLDSTEASRYGTGPPDHSHQCMWVFLDAPSGDANFVEAGARRNMDFRKLSSLEQTAEINVRGARKSRAKQQVRLFVHCRLLNVDRKMFLTLSQGAGESIIQGGKFEEYRFWAWFVKGYINIHKTLEIEGQKIPLWQDIGSFGHVLAHEGPTDSVHYKLDGSGVNQIDDAVYEVQLVERVQIKYEIATEKGGKEDPWRAWPQGGVIPKGGKGDGRDHVREPLDRLPWWNRLLRRWPDDPRPFPRLPDQ